MRQKQEWQAWLAAASLPQGEVQLDAGHIPAMARRRLGRLAKMAVCVADDVLASAAAPDIPVVWGSRYGDAEKSLALLRVHVQGQEALSPTAFGLSVHNAVGSQHSILRGMRSNALCVAGGQCAPEAAVVEALGLLHDGAPQVMCVVYDAPLPSPYDCFHDETMLDLAWAVLLSLPQAGQPCFALERGASPDVATTCTEERGLPHMLQVLRFLIDPQQLALSFPHGTGQWTWRRASA